MGSAEGVADLLGWIEGNAAAWEGAMDTEGWLLTDGRRLGWEVGSELVVGITLGWLDGIADVLGRMLSTTDGPTLGLDDGEVDDEGTCDPSMVGLLLGNKEGPELTVGCSLGEAETEGVPVGSLLPVGLPEGTNDGHSGLCSMTR